MSRGKGRNSHIKVLRSQSDLFSMIYPTMTNSDLASYFNVPIGVIRNFSVELGIRKHPAWKAYCHRIASTGRIHTAETRQKISAGNKGKKYSPETRAKMSAARRARPRKSGRISRYRDPRYKEWREAVLSRDEYRCQRCSRQGFSSGRGLEAHHLHGWTMYPALRYEVTNGITLCCDCHDIIHGKRTEEPQELPLCACGCGARITGKKPDAKFIRGHNSRLPYNIAHLSRIKEASLAAVKGKPLSPDHRQKVGLAHKGKPKSDEQKAKMSESARAWWQAHKAQTS